MTSHSVLQILDVNSREIDRSPARKRARYVSPVKAQWTISKSDLTLEEIYDCGVDVLDSGSDDENGPLKENSNVAESSASSSEKTTRDTLRPPAKDSSKIARERLQQMAHKSADEYCYEDSDRNFFDGLSDEVILYIFQFLPKRCLMDIVYVCRRWHCITQDESLWTRMDVSNKNLQPGAIGHILSRQVIILRLAHSHIASPAISPGCRASFSDFKGRLLYLDLSNAHISYDSLIEVFNKCNKLKKISLECVRVNKDVMSALAQCADLEVVNLSMAEGLEIEGLTNLLSSCKKLRELNLAWTCLSSSSINYVCTNLPETIDRLNLSGCRKSINNKNILDIVACCSGLRELDLSDSTALTGEAVKHITLLDELNFLALSRCYLIPYLTLLQLKKLSSLVYLDLHGGHIDENELSIIQECVGSRLNINKFKFSSIARPAVGSKHSSIWNIRVRD